MNIQPTASLPSLYENYVKLRLADASLSCREQYVRNVRRFGESLGRIATVADLTSDNVALYLAGRRGQGASPETCNKERSQLLALGRFAAMRGVIPAPHVAKLKTPRRVPQAFTRQDFGKLLAQAERLRGWMHDGITAADWWVSFLTTIWFTGLRRGAMLSLPYGALDWNAATLHVPAEVQKHFADQLFDLSGSAMDALARVRIPSRELLFPTHSEQPTLYGHLSRMLKAAGLPDDRWHKFHAVRKSHASYWKASGGDACERLGHSSPQVTALYLDPLMPSPIMPGESEGGAT